MCDTLFKRNKEQFIFGKNSDRSCNEPNLVLYIPKKKHTDKAVQTTYLSIPQVSQTNAMILVKPSWTWGAEMGINEYGVCIGNEAVFTKSKDRKKNSLIGMDYVRLGLERAKTSKEAVDVICQMLEKFGQGGNCGFDKAFYYDNSYIIGDDNHAYILETVGRKWLVEEIEQGGNISNRLRIKEGCFFSHEKSLLHYKEPVFTFFSKAKKREEQAEEQIKSDLIGVKKMMAILQSHTVDFNTLVNKGSVSSLCMHQSLLGDHTTGSMIVVGRRVLPKTIWLAAGSTPCLSLYLPYFFKVAPLIIPDDPKSALEDWLNHEYLVRSVMVGLINKKEYEEQIRTLQQSWIKQEQEIIEKNPDKEELYAFSKQCKEEVNKITEKYRFEIEQFKSGNWQKPALWKKKSALLGINVMEKDYRIRYRKRL
ncbi:MAG: hypothetical protein PHP41_00235 [Bacilli bacterium]|nr:hypothetical protein [Bacilli bacterium]